eukprot:g3968.t1
MPSMKGSPPKGGRSERSARSASAPPPTTSSPLPPSAFRNMKGKGGETTDRRDDSSSTLSNSASDLEGGYEMVKLPLTRHGFKLVAGNVLLKIVGTEPKMVVWRDSPIRVRRISTPFHRTWNRGPVRQGSFQLMVKGIFQGVKTGIDKMVKSPRMDSVGEGAALQFLSLKESTTNGAPSVSNNTTSASYGDTSKISAPRDETGGVGGGGVHREGDQDKLDVSSSLTRANASRAPSPIPGADDLFYFETLIVSTRNGDYDDNDDEISRAKEAGADRHKDEGADDELANSAADILRLSSHDSEPRSRADDEDHPHRSAHRYQIAIGIVEERVDNNFERSLVPALIQNTLPGYLTNSWGFHSNGSVYVSDQELGRSGRPYGPSFGEGDVVGCGWDWRHGILFFTKNGVRLPSAFYGLVPRRGRRYFPTIGTAGGTTVSSKSGALDIPAKDDVATRIKEVMSQCKRSRRGALQIVRELGSSDEVLADYESRGIFFLLLRLNDDILRAKYLFDLRTNKRMEHMRKSGIALPFMFSSRLSMIENRSDVSIRDGEVHRRSVGGRQQQHRNVRVDIRNERDEALLARESKLFDSGDWANVVWWPFPLPARAEKTSAADETATLLQRWLFLLRSGGWQLRYEAAQKLLRIGLQIRRPSDQISMIATTLHALDRLFVEAEQLTVVKEMAARAIVTIVAATEATTLAQTSTVQNVFERALANVVRVLTYARSQCDGGACSALLISLAADRVVSFALRDDAGISTTFESAFEETVALLVNICTPKSTATCENSVADAIIAPSVDDDDDGNDDERDRCHVFLEARKVAANALLKIARRELLRQRLVQCGVLSALVPLLHCAERSSVASIGSSDGEKEGSKRPDAPESDVDDELHYAAAMSLAWLCALPRVRSINSIEQRRQIDIYTCGWIGAKIVDHDALPHLVYLASSEAQYDRRAVGAAARVLSNLASFAPNRKAMVESGAIPALIRGITLQLKTGIPALIASIGDSSGGARRRGSRTRNTNSPGVRNDTGTPGNELAGPASSGVSTFKSDDDVIFYLVHTLSQLIVPVQSYDPCKELVACDGIRHITSLLGIQSVRVQLDALRTLSKCAEVLAPEMIRCDVLSRLLRLVNTDNVEIRLRIAQIVANISEAVAELPMTAVGERLSAPRSPRGLTTPTASSSSMGEDNDDVDSKTTASSHKQIFAMETTLLNTGLLRPLVNLFRNARNAEVVRQTVRAIANLA